MNVSTKRQKRTTETTESSKSEGDGLKFLKFFVYGAVAVEGICIAALGVGGIIIAVITIVCCIGFEDILKD